MAEYNFTVDDLFDDILNYDDEYSAQLIQNTQRYLIYPHIEVEDDHIAKHVEIDVLDDGPIKKFIIGEKFSEEQERTFIHYIRNGERLLISECEWELFCANVSTTFPNLNLKHVAFDDFQVALEHIYYASFASGIKEILYKAQLCYLSFFVNMIIPYNAQGTTPSAIFGTPIRLLRILEDNTELIFRLITGKETLKQYNDIYEAFGGFIGSDKITIAQWDYLKELYFNGAFIGKSFSRSLFNRLGFVSNSMVLNEIKRYFSFAEEFPFIKKVLPDFDYLDEIVEKIALFKSLVNSDIDEKISKRNCKNIFGYSGKDFIVTMPQNLKEIFEMSQNNCLMTYACSHADNETTIVFIRSALRPQDIYAIAEINDYEIVQVRTRYNNLPSVEVFKFLEDYSKKVYVKYNPWLLIMDDDKKCEDETLLTYVHEYCTRTEYPSFPEEDEYQQLLLEDYYPGAFIAI